MVGRYRDPVEAAHALGNYIHPEDGCPECGYLFEDSTEGCDSCRPITQALGLIGRNREGEA